ncbi:hypothetical protein ACFL2C_02400, partial [Patescibacteria group bacterium]
MGKTSPGLVGFLQASAVAIYCLGVGSLMWQGDRFFGKVNNFLGPVLFLVLFVVSAVACTLIYFWYPFQLFWEK